jgi:transcriptional regulator with XRE-family HTH domain
VQALLADPERAARVAAIRQDMAQADRDHAQGLAQIRLAARLTQQELANRLGVSQVAVQRSEQRADMLLSTLRSYLLAAGADLELIVRWDDGRRTELTLGEATQQGQTEQEPV